MCTILFKHKSWNIIHSSTVNMNIIMIGFEIAAHAEQCAVGVCVFSHHRLNRHTIWYFNILRLNASSVVRTILYLIFVTRPVL